MPHIPKLLGSLIENRDGKPCHSRASRLRRQWPLAWVAQVVLAALCLAAPSRAATGFLDVGDSRLFYETTGAGPALVFLHDGHMHGVSWKAQWNELAKSHRLIRYDRRGYGQSTPATGPYSDVADLHALLGHLQVTNAVLIGSSAGGRLALDYALEHPAKVRRLVLVGAVVSGLDFSEHFDRRVREGFRPLRERNDVGGAITNWMNDPWLIAPTNRAAREYFREVMTAHPHNLTRTGQHTRPPARLAAGRLSEIQVPTLILVGESDMPDVHAHCGAIQAGVVNAWRIVVPGASHFVHVERPAEFNSLVTRFLMGSGLPKDLVYYVPAMERAIVRSNLTYKTVDGAPLRLDVYRPPDTAPDDRRPAILFVLGDASPETLRNAKDWTFMRSYGRLAAATGFVGITFNHRSSENATRLPEVRADIDDLIHHVRTNATPFGIDPSRICLWFFSGSGVHWEAGLGENAAFVRCIVGYYPLLAPSRRLSLSDDLRRKFTASAQLQRHSSRIPPLFLAKAGRDSLSLNQTLDEFREQAVRSGIAMELLEHPSGEHAFDLRNDDETSRDIVRRTLEFVRRHLQR